jgi:SAM-dependent methyltransferase
MAARNERGIEMTRLDASREFWDEKARENPYWYVSSAGPYAGRDMADFWASGPRIWSDLKRVSGYEAFREAVIVEIGCGVGRLTCALAREAGHVLAFDVSAEMLKVAATSVTESNVTFHLADSPDLPQLPEGCADAFVAYCVFQHLPGNDTLRRYLQAAVRVLKPGGMLIFTLTPPDWRDRLAVALRARRWLVELSSADGPRGLYKREWYGIRPSKREVEQLSPIAVRQTNLHGDKWLFHGRR